jgi:hypothetical protein
VAGENIVLTVYELAKEGLRFIAHPKRAERGWRWLKLFMSIWVRNFFTLAVSRDLYEGVPAIYVNYLGYDETAHRYGPRSDRAMRVLHEVDRTDVGRHKVRAGTPVQCLHPGPPWSIGMHPLQRPESWQTAGTLDLRSGFECGTRGRP